MEELFAGAGWAYQRARVLLSKHFLKPTPADMSSSEPPPLTSADFGPAVLDPRVSGVGDIPELLTGADGLPGGVLPTGYQLLDLNPAGDQEVVGELRYLATLKHIRQIYDKNAVAVLEPVRSGEHPQVRVSLLSGDRYFYVGYLPRDQGLGYVPILERLARQRKIGLCPARLWWPQGQDEHMIQVYLRLAPPDELLPEAPPLGQYLNLTGYSTVVVTNEEEHQQALDFFGPQPKLWFHLGFCTIQDGKYRGEQTVQVRLEDHVVGQLTYLMGQRYGSAVRAGLNQGQTVICQGRIVEEEERGLQVELFMLSQSAVGASVRYDVVD